MNELRRRLRLLLRRLNFFSDSRTSSYDHNAGNTSGPSDPGTWKDVGDRG